MRHLSGYRDALAKEDEELLKKLIREARTKGTTWLMQKKLILGFLLLLVVGLAISLYLRFFVPYGSVAQVFLNGESVGQIDLNTVSVPYTLQVGDGNTVLVENGAISMHSADCPDQLCVKQGKITGGVYPIVCLPNRVTVKILARNEDEPDVIAGGAVS